MSISLLNASRSDSVRGRLHSIFPAGNISVVDRVVVLIGDWDSLRQVERGRSMAIDGSKDVRWKRRGELCKPALKLLVDLDLLHGGVQRVRRRHEPGVLLRRQRSDKLRDLVQLCIRTHWQLFIHQLVVVHVLDQLFERIFV
jgi:hypothetical protein